MPIRIPENLPAMEILNQENIFVMGEERAYHQDIRPLKIVILNLMPIKETTEIQLLRLLGNSPLQVDIVLMHIDSHVCKNTAQEHMDSFYKSFDEIKGQKFDGMIITGAPVEQLEFEEVTYWEDLKVILDWTQTHVTSTFHICWGAQAGLYHHYGIPKYALEEKKFGIFQHNVNKSGLHGMQLLRGFDDEFSVPHSRHTEIRHCDLESHPELEVLSESNEAGIYLIVSKDGRQVFATGHSEYDTFTLKDEYDRDIAKGLPIALPVDYYPNDDPAQTPVHKWRSHTSLLFQNWLNYYVYQATPYDLSGR